MSSYDLNDANPEGPSVDDLAEIEREMPLIDAEVLLLDAQIAILCAEPGLVQRRVHSSRPTAAPKTRL